MADSGRSAEARSAREARALLAAPLAALQQPGSPPDWGVAAQSIAEASSVLFQLETSAETEAYGAIRSAVANLSRALGTLQAAAQTHPVEEAVEALARTLALLYPLARSHQRRRRRVVLDLFGQTEAPSEPMNPPAPEPVGHAPEGRPFGGNDKRRRGDRVFVEVDIGLASQSHFYTGLSRDLSRGGVFIATYQPQPPGTAVLLYFVLPNGRRIEARGVVRWSSDAAGDFAPGMGVAFEALSPDDLEAIVDFCEARSPLYHHSADD